MKRYIKWVLLFSFTAWLLIHFRLFRKRAMAKAAVEHVMGAEKGAYGDNWPKVLEDQIQILLAANSWWGVFLYRAYQILPTKRKTVNIQ